MNQGVNQRLFMLGARQKKCKPHRNKKNTHTHTHCRLRHQLECAQIQYPVHIPRASPPCPPFNPTRLSNSTSCISCECVEAVNFEQTHHQQTKVGRSGPSCSVLRTCGDEENFCFNSQKMQQPTKAKAHEKNVVGLEQINLHRPP